MSVSLDSGTVDVLSTHFVFSDTAIEIAWTNPVPTAFCYCHSNLPQSGKHRINFRIGTRLTTEPTHTAVIFCQKCGFRLEFKWGPAMPIAEIEKQLTLAASCSWPGSDKGFM